MELNHAHGLRVERNAREDIKRQSKGLEETQKQVSTAFNEVKDAATDAGLAMKDFQFRIEAKI